MTDDPNDERWRDLCAQASVERDPERLNQLVSEILRLLDEREERTQRSRRAGFGPPSVAFPQSSWIPATHR